MKKHLIGIVIFSLFVSTSFADYDKKKSGWNDPIYGNIEFSAYLSNGTVMTKWSKFQSNEKFKYYKVIRSNSNNNPVYPDDGYIKYSGDINFTQYVDNSPSSAYYRVCAMTHERNRYCSNVVWVEVGDLDKYEKKKEYEKEIKKPKHERTEGISWKIQKKLDNWLKKT